MKVRVYYMAEIERDSVKQAEEDVLMNPNMLQHYETEVEIEEDNFDPLRIDLNIRKHFDLILQLNKVDKKDFKGIDKSTIEVVYENITTKGVVYTAQAILSKYMFVFYFPFRRGNHKVIRVLSKVAEHVVGKLISEDVAKDKPSLLDEALA
jgi:hypothetical protein